MKKLRLKISPPLAAALMLVAARKNFADTVELNGLTSLFGDNTAFLILYQPAAARPVALTLSEGESQFGIKLVAVDAANHRVQIERAGVKKFLTLHAATGISAPATAETAAEAEKISAPDSKQLAAYLHGHAETEAAKANAVVPNFAGGGAANSSGQNSGGGKNSGSTTDDSATGSNHSATDTTKQDWYQDSLAIEQERLNTAQDVLDGNATPWPRTPLTPAGTPAQLIGRETFFSNHIPGYVSPGYVQSLAAPE